MALSSSTFSDIGGAASDLFAGIGKMAEGGLKAKGLQITAAGTRLSAESTRLTAQGLRIKSAGDIAEADNYDLAAALAEKNSAYTDQSTRVSLSQQDRQVTQAIGGQQASVAGAGFASSGSALDLLRDSQSQGALAHGVLSQQGIITEEGFNEQAKSFETMSAAGRATAAGELDIANKTDTIATQQDAIAAQQDQLARDTQNASNNSAFGSFFTSALKGVAAVASIALAPATGGLSLAATAGLDGLDAIH